ncbi:MAG TPA: BatA domain-containing protein [Chryseolinea sp.]|nr:BatA domain-containing protein [Chryseolinea sp.]
MQLINPIWLWGLTGLLIPIGIHLLSRKEGKIIKFGSLRHLEESQTKQSIKVRLNEVALLMLRCVLIFLIVILLCGLSINLFQSQKSQWLVLEDGLERDTSIKSLVDSLKQQGFEVKSMKKGFPDVSGEQTEPFTNYWELVDKLPVESLDEVIIVSYSFASKFRGKRLSLPENVTWISKEPEQKEFALSGIKFSNDSVLVRMGKSSALQTSFTNQTERVDQLASQSSSEKKITPIPPDTLSVTIYADTDFEYDRKIITAALRAIEKTIPIIFKTSSVAPAENQSDDHSDWIIWLSQKDPGALNASSIIFREDLGSNALLKRVKGKDQVQWQIMNHLNEENALKEQLPLSLSHILLNEDLIQARADSLDQTIQPEELLWSGDKSNTSSASIRLADSQNDQYLLVAIIALLVIERFIASKRNA